jgi:hypothetical protein
MYKINAFSLLQIASFGALSNIPFATLVADEHEAKSVVASSHVNIAKAPSLLRLEQVSLFPNGLGIFEFEGPGGSEIDLSMTREELDDVLKSAVLEGFDDVSIAYDFKPERTATSRRLNNDSTATLAEIVQQFRGWELEIVNPDQSRQGIVVAVESQVTERADETYTQELVSLLSGEALERIALVPSSKLKWTDPKIEKEFRKAAADQAAPLDTRASVKIRVEGPADRPGRLAIQWMCAPWKPSYRIFKGVNGFELSVSAVIDNTTALDWDSVRLRLVIDQPLGFRSPLSSVLASKRKTIDLPVPHSVAPIGLAGRNPETVNAANVLAMSDQDWLQRQSMITSSGGMGGSGMGGLGGGGMGGMGGGAMWNGPRLSQDEDPFTEEQPIETRQFGAKKIDVSSFQNIVGNRVQIEVKKFSVRAGASKATSFPSVPHSIREVLVHAPSLFKSQPLVAFQLTLLQEYRLPSGPGSVWTAQGYSGDIMVPKLDSHMTQLLPYAVDSSVSVEVASTTHEQDRFEWAWLGVDHKQIVEARLKRMSTQYLIQNRSNEKRELLLEHASQGASWSPLDAEPSTASDSNLTESGYRYSVILGASSDTKKSVVETGREERNLSINTEIKSLELIAASTDLPNDMRAKIQKWISIIQEKKTVQGRVEEQRSSLSDSKNQQVRVQNLMKDLSRQDAIHKRYLDKMASFEDKIERLEVQLAADLQELKSMEQKIENEK